MDNLLFYALIALLLWYFWQRQKKPASFRPSLKPTTSQSTQTDFIKSPLRSDTSLTDPEPITQFPYDPGPESAKTLGAFPLSESDQQALESTLDFLIKEMRELDKALD